MNANVRFPRQLEADGTAAAIRQALLAHTARIWPGGGLEVPLLTVSDSFKSIMNHAWQKDQLCCGFELVTKKLQREAQGLAHMRMRADAVQGDRISRLLLWSNDGAERFYRHVERLLQIHAPRVLGCRLDIDAGTLGQAVTGKERRIKLVMAEHKDAVCEILRALVAGHARPRD